MIRMNKIIWIAIWMIAQVWGKSFKMYKKTILTQEGNSDCISPLENNNTIVSLGNCFNLYYITLGIGTPAQFFDFQFDTGSNVLWIPTIQALNKGFDTKASSTFDITDQVYSIEYADESKVVGLVGEDVITVDGTVIKHSGPILFVEREQGMNFPGSVEGLVGMGYSNIPNFLDEAFEAGEISSSSFTLKLRNTSWDESEMYYDEIPEHILSNTTFVSVYGSGYWQVQLVGMYADDKDFTYAAAKTAIIDSGTTLFYLNQDLYDAISAAYLSECYKVDEVFVCDCELESSMPKLTFMFNGVEVFLQPSDYFVPLNQSDGVCEARINTLGDESEQVLLGDTLFQNYIITFDKTNSQIGFNGNLEIVEVFGEPYFIDSQYAMVAVCVLYFLFACYLMYHLRVQKIYQQKKKKDLDMYLINNQNL